MTTPTILRRNLTFHFQRSVVVTSTSSTTDSVEVSVIPLADPSSAIAVATFVGGLQSQTVLLANEDNPVVFSLVPTDEPGLSVRILYRVMWRVGGITGRTETFDFAMPDQDLDFDELQELGNVITGEVYLQQSDLSVPGRVAQLNDLGQVVDSSGTPVAGQADVSGLQNQLNAEIVAREQAVATAVSNAEAELDEQINSAITTGQTALNAAITTLTTGDAVETAARIASETTISSAVAALSTAVTANAASDVASFAAVTADLANKADLDGTAHVPLAEIPTSAITAIIPVSNQVAMLALTTPAQVQKGDIAVRPDAAFALEGTGDPSILSNWLDLSKVYSVNGQTGVVTLTAANVGAMAPGASITQSQVTGLATTLSGLTSTSVTTALQTQVTNILADPTYVHTVSGFIPNALNDASMAYVNNLNQITKKDGTVLSGGGGGTVASVNGQTGVVTLGASNVGAIAVGASITQSQVTGLSTALGLLVASTDVRLTNARIPTAHAGTHAAAGTDPVTLAQSQITGLSALISGNELTSSTNAINRISTLETLVSGGGGGGGGGSASTTEFWTDANITSDVTDFTTIDLHSPFGIYTTGGSIGNPYYNYNGVPGSDAAFVTITPNGHLKLYQWNESGPADPIYALESDLTTLNTSVGSLTTTVATKALQTDMTTAQASITALQTGKADLVMGTVPLGELPSLPQSQITGLAATLAAKADLSGGVLATGQIPTAIPQSSITGLTGTFAAKADLVSGTVPLAELPTNIPATSITGLPAVLTTKADLVSGTVPLAELPSIPQTQVTGLLTTLSGYATLTSGVLTTAQIPTNIPQTSVTGLGATFAGKADLTGGTLNVSEIPFQAIQHTYVVANRAAMLALTTSQVHVSDTCVINATVDQGTYILMSTPPSVFTNWQLASSGIPPVSSVNGYTGTVVLAASDVGALSAGAAIPQSQVTGLVSALAGTATTTALTSGLALKTAFTDVQNMLTASVPIKAVANYVCTVLNGVPSLAGQQSVDGVVTPVGATVLLTSQPSSVNNGLWIVNVVTGGNPSGLWTRPTDTATGTYIVKDTLVLVSAGSTQANTFWQMTSPSGVVDTNAQSFSRVMQAGPPLTYTNGNGLNLAGQSFSVQPTVGCTVTSAGVGVDFTRVPQKYTGGVPAGSTMATIPHNLNTTSIMVQVIEVSSGSGVLVGWATQGLNAVTLEFSSAPTSGQWKVIVIG